MQNMVLGIMRVVETLPSSTALVTCWGLLLLSLERPGK